MLVLEHVNVFDRGTGYAVVEMRVALLVEGDVWIIARSSIRSLLEV